MLAAPRLTEDAVEWRLRGMAAIAAVALVTIWELSSALSVSPGRVVPAVAVVAIPALLAMGFLPPRAAAAAVILSAPVTLLAAGVPVGDLAPGVWPRLVKALGTGAAQPIAGAGRWTFTASVLAALVLITGVLWTTGAALGTSARGPDHLGGHPLRLVAGFALLVSPWVTVVSVTSPGQSAWQGAVVLVAGVLWFRSGRAALAIAVVAAAPSVAVADAIGPSSRWFGLAGRTVASPAFRTLAVEPTYGPLTQRRNGATMLIVTAPAPGLWRMETLDYADGSWVLDAGARPRLPQPAARREDLRVGVAGLRENLVVAPGQIERVSAKGKVEPADGGGMLVTPMPMTGDSYRVTASVVRATASQLSRDRAPLSADARMYTHLVAPLRGGDPLQQLPWLLGPLMAVLRSAHQPALDPRVVTLARRLAAGARTEWEIVTRVERYLLGGRRFRYTTDVAPPGPQPLVDFLLRTHAGYCQHFAGAAALLLRLAGVPARVVTGFATGKRVGIDRYIVRDLDAHEWIEVYFEGYGWVPFNPTPAAAPALVAGVADPRRPSPHPAQVWGNGHLAAALMAVLAAGAAVYRRRRRTAPASRDSLWRVARLAGAQPEAPTTLAQARAVLAARIGPRTAAIADDLERERFAAEAPPPPKRPRVRLARALLGDLGPVRMLVLLCAPRPRRRTARRPRI
jgi:transglutaminase-like putative cysteine protease